MTGSIVSRRRTIGASLLLTAALTVPWATTVDRADARAVYAITGAETSDHVPNGAGAVVTFGATGGELLPLGDPVPTNGEGPSSAAIAPDGRNLYVANGRSRTIAAFTLSRDGRPVPNGPPAPALAGTSTTISPSPDGRFLFVADGSQIVTMTIRADGRLQRVGAPVSLPGADITRWIVVEPAGRFLYVTGFHHRSDPADPGYSSQLWMLSIASDGTLKNSGLAPAVWGQAFSPDGRFLYGISSAGWARTYVVRPPWLDDPGATLTAIGVSADGGDDPAGVLAPDGRRIYGAGTDFVGATHETTRPVTRLTSFAIDDRGGFTRLGVPPRFGSGGTQALAISPSGRQLFVTQGTDRTILPLTTGVDGQPRPSGAAQPLGGMPVADGLVVRPNQGPRAVLAPIDDAVLGTPIRVDGRASNDADGRVERYEWDFGDGATATGAIQHHVYEHPGTFTVRLKVTDDEGCSERPVLTGQTAHCNGNEAAITTRRLTVRGGSTGSTPSVSGLTADPRTFRISRGTEISFRSTARTVARLTVERRAAGRRRGRSCVPVGDARRSAQRCTRYVPLRGALAVTARRGTNRQRFRGRIGGQRLTAGRYRLTVAPRGHRTRGDRIGLRVVSG